MALRGYASTTARPITPLSSLILTATMSKRSARAEPKAIMASIVREVRIDARPERVWDALRDVGALRLGSDSNPRPRQFRDGAHGRGPSARKIPAMLFCLRLALILAARTVFISGVLAGWAVKQVVPLWLGKR